MGTPWWEVMVLAQRSGRMGRCDVGGQGRGCGECHEMDNLCGGANKRLIIVGTFMTFAFK